MWFGSFRFVLVMKATCNSSIIVRNDDATPWGDGERSISFWGSPTQEIRRKRSKGIRAVFSRMSTCLATVGGGTRGVMVVGKPGYLSGFGRGVDLIFDERFG